MEIYEKNKSEVWNQEGTLQEWGERSRNSTVNSHVKLVAPPPLADVVPVAPCVVVPLRLVSVLVLKIVGIQARVVSATIARLVVGCVLADLVSPGMSVVVSFVFCSLGPAILKPLYSLRMFLYVLARVLILPSS